jgi:hypothetical protein
MEKTMMEEVVWVDGYLLMVYYSPRKCYGFSVVDEEGKVHNFESIFYTVAAARKEGLTEIFNMSW